MKIKNLVHNTLKQFNVAAIRYDGFRRLMENSRAGDDFELLLRFPDEQIPLALRSLKKSKSQLRQDLFVLSELGFKRNGFFVEFGATDGIVLSNTHLLEHEFGWTGILSEPAHCWHEGLKNNRSCNIETQCVWSDTGSILTFNEVNDAELSTVSEFSSSDKHHKARKIGKSYEVKTISLVDLLDKYKAPRIVDYLSIDTEGSEFEILSHFDFNRYSFRVITCEHNNTPARETIYRLLTSKGYKRKFEDLSKFDDWYVKE